MEEDEDNQIAQLVSLGNRDSTPTNKISITFNLSKEIMQQLIYILSSANTQSYAGYSLKSANFLVADGNTEEFFLNKKSLNDLAYGLTKYYQWKYADDSKQWWLNVRNREEYKKGGVPRVVINLDFDVDNEREDEFHEKIKSQLNKDHEKETMVEPPSDFNLYTDEVIGQDLYDAKEIPKRQKKYINDRQYIYDINDEEIPSFEENLDFEQEAPKRKRRRREYEKTKALPTRTKRFKGKYGKGINFDLLNSHCIRYHSLTGNIDIYNNLQNIKKEICKLRRNAFKTIHVE
jgi:hypothetical protein